MPSTWPLSKIRQERSDKLRHIYNGISTMNPRTTTIPLMPTSRLLSSVLNIRKILSLAATTLSKPTPSPQRLPQTRPNQSTDIPTSVIMDESMVTKTSGNIGPPPTLRTSLAKPERPKFCRVTTSSGSKSAPQLIRMGTKAGNRRV